MDTLALERLAWLAGCWRRETAGRVEEGVWLPPGGGCMVGLHRDQRAGEAAVYELLSIQAEGATLVLRVVPRGGGALRFELSECSSQRVDFVRKGGTFPTSVRYWRREDVLHALIRGPGGRSLEWSWPLISDWPPRLQPTPSAP